MTDDTDTPDMLAAEYVLGTLATNEREQAEALIANDPAFAQLVRYWERNIGELHAMVQSVEPPAETWARIKARLDGVEPSAEMLLPHPDHAARVAAESNVVDLTRRLSRWRQAATGLGALAAALVAVVVTVAVDPQVLPGPLRPKSAEPGRFVAVLQQNASAPAFILTIDVATRTASVRRVSGGPPPGKSYELWLVSDRFPAPRSLGLVGTTDFAKPTLASYDPAVISNATYAVSLEPEGGSPNGRPTEVLYAGKLVESVPPSP
jgi:anti-sigma-K factor RskA